MFRASMAVTEFSNAFTEPRPLMNRLGSIVLMSISYAAVDSLSPITITPY